MSLTDRLTKRLKTAGIAAGLGLASMFSLSGCVSDGSNSSNVSPSVFTKAAAIGYRMAGMPAAAAAMDFAARGEQDAETAQAGKTEVVVDVPAQSASYQLPQQPTQQVPVEAPKPVSSQYTPIAFTDWIDINHDGIPQPQEIFDKPGTVFCANNPIYVALEGGPKSLDLFRDPGFIPAFGFYSVIDVTFTLFNAQGREVYTEKREIKRDSMDSPELRKPVRIPQEDVVPGTYFALWSAVQRDGGWYRERKNGPRKDIETQADLGYLGDRLKIEVK